MLVEAPYTHGHVPSGGTENDTAGDVPIVLRDRVLLITIERLWKCVVWGIEDSDGYLRTPGILRGRSRLRLYVICGVVEWLARQEGAAVFVESKEHEKLNTGSSRVYTFGAIPFWVACLSSKFWNYLFSHFVETCKAQLGLQMLLNSTEHSMSISNNFCN